MLALLHETEPRVIDYDRPTTEVLFTGAALRARPWPTPSAASFVNAAFA